MSKYTIEIPKETMRKLAQRMGNDGVGILQAIKLGHSATIILNDKAVNEWLKDR